jgi:hypothetical protein
MSLRAANRLKHVKIDLASSGDLVAAPSGSTVGQKIRVISYGLTAANATTTIKFQSGGSTDLSGAMTLAQGVALARDGSLDSPVLECAKDAKLNLVLGGTPGQVSGHLTYEIVPAIP